jgi:ABC-type Na+ transport system ATPase subunit NatA
LVAVQEVSFEVATGAILGMLDPDGTTGVLKG